MSDRSLDHKIRPAGGGFELVTHYGYVLGKFGTLPEAKAYYAEHCPSETTIELAIAAARERQNEDRARMTARR